MLPITVLVLFYRKLMAAGRIIVLPAVLTSAPALALTQAGLQEFEIHHCSQTHCFSAVGKKADISLMSPLMAAESVALKIHRISEKENPKVFICESFTYHLKNPYLTCETSMTTLSWDPTSERLNFFKR